MKMTFAMSKELQFKAVYGFYVKFTRMGSAVLLLNGIKILVLNLSID
jgi:hypothetical protein